MKNAVVASEDRTFYENNGISIKGIARALWNNIRGGATQGGSTLTQQYAERYYLGGTTSLLGKAKEAILALKIDGSQSKDEILANYLNTIYFGRGAYGVEAAARAYFNIAAKDLTLPQAALLTAVIPAPSAWDPAVNPQKAQQRYERVLKLMAEDEWISPAERDQAFAAFPQSVEPKSNNVFGGTNGYLLQTVKEELVNTAGFTAEEISTGGYKIVTTFNREKQQALVDAVNSLPEDRPANNHVGAYSLNPQNGEVYALYGGADYLKQQLNDATQSRAQAGSTFKIFTLVGAIENGIPMHRKFPAPATMRIPGTDQTISNSGMVNYGALDLVGMTRTSANTPYAAVNLEIGPQTTVDTAVKMGIPKDNPGLAANVGNPLGSASVTAKQMAAAYSVVAGEGKLYKPHTVKSVAKMNGANVFSGDTAGKQILSKETAALATHAFRSVMGAGTDVAKRIGVQTEREFAGKSGTSTGPVSGWFIGYTPQMVTAVNMFQVGPNGEQEQLSSFGKVRTIYGATFPLDVWWKYTKAALKETAALKFPDVRELLAAQNLPPAVPKETAEESEEQANQEEEAGAVTPPAENSPQPGTAPVPDETVPKNQEEPKPADPSPNPRRNPPNNPGGNNPGEAPEG
ncbi:transglycosylase domain-containing protein [Arcanobacterium hippocoleae]